MSTKTSYGKAHCKNKECNTSWDSMTQLRKARKGLDKKKQHLCPKCQEPLAKRQAVGLY